MKDERDRLPPVEVKQRTRTTKICAKCGGAWPTTYAINGVQLFECRRRAPGESDRPGQRMYWKTTLADEGCAEWIQR